MIEYGIVFLLLTPFLFYQNQGSLVSLEEGNESRGKEEMSFFGEILFLCILYGLRSISVGVDTRFYAHAFLQIRELPFERLLTSPIYPDASMSWTISLEPGYRVFNKLLGIFSDNPQVLLCVSGILLFGMLILFIREHSPMPVLSVWLYYVLGFFQTHMNVSRNALAILFGYAGFCWLKKRKLLPFLLIILGASLFHSSVLLFLPFYWISKIRCSSRRMSFVILFSVILGVLLTTCGGQLAELWPKYARYLTGGQGKAEAVCVGIVHVCLVGTIFLFQTQEERKASFGAGDPGFWMLTANLGALCMSFQFQAASRMAGLFGPYLIVLLPQLLEKIREKQRKKRAVTAVVLLAAFFYVARILVNNIGGTVPYRFFFFT